VHAVRNEMARSPEDVVRRRLPLALLCPAGSAALARATDLARTEIHGTALP